MSSLSLGPLGSLARLDAERPTVRRCDWGPPHMEIGVLAWLLFGVVSAVVARKKGRSGCVWFGLGVLLGPFGLLLAFAASPGEGQVIAPSEPPSPLKKCPSCGELMRQDEARCRSCDEKAASARKVPSGSGTEYWTCPRCGVSNASKFVRCGNCGYSVE
jgi:uncharacterized C2H2 Zn-finger protein